MKNPTSGLLTRHHATMVSMTSPESPRTSWPQRQFRLDDQSWKSVRVKLATDEEKWQNVMETLAWGWISGLIDVNEVREKLRTDPAAKLWRNLLPPPKDQ
jgi:hypothetical protein